MKRVPENGHDRHHHHPNEEYLVHSFFPALPHSDDMILEEVFVRYVFFVFYVSLKIHVVQALYKAREHSSFDLGVSTVAPNTDSPTSSQGIVGCI